MTIKSPDVGPLEMKVLGLLDGQAPMGVSDIQKGLRKSSDSELAYTTVMTVLVRLYNKGYLKREKNGRQFKYFSVDGKSSASQKLFERVKRSLFQNQRLKPILALLESESNLTEAELKELRKAVDVKLKQTQTKS
jgi:BlaI family transcriptional regulator, penicillinase repressor